MTNQTSPNPTQETIVLGGGCFWCLEAVYLDVAGVSRVTSGYAGGHDPAPNYESVCSGSTGHAEVVEVAFNPATISLEQILAIFFTIHDPTTLNRQGHDVGTQYRSVVYTADDRQLAAVRAFIARLEAERVYDRPIVTEVAPLSNHHAAEAYHQRYFENHPHQGYCMAVVAPKVAKFRTTFDVLRRR